MSMQLGTHFEYPGEYARAVPPSRLMMKLKAAVDLMIGCSPALWILFFAGLTALVNLVVGH
jgi:hypothetical protein